jgi:hypothetical protein
MRSFLLWDVTRPSVVLSYRRFVTTCRSQQALTLWAQLLYIPLTSLNAQYICCVEQQRRMRIRLDIFTLLEDFEIWSQDFWCLKSTQLLAQSEGHVAP